MDSVYENLALRGELSANLVGFCRYMRFKGLNLGIGEQMDALRALEELDFKYEKFFRMALRTTLAKSTKEQEIFDENFYIHSGMSGIMLRIFTTSLVQSKQDTSVIKIEHTTTKKSFVSISDWLSDDDLLKRKKNLLVTVLLKLHLNVISVHFRQMNSQN